MDFKEKSFDYANDSIKLIISLATGVLALTVTFLKDVVGQKTIHSKGLLISSWFLLLLTILFGIWTNLAITGTLNEMGRNIGSKKTIMNSNIRIPSGLTLLSFIGGIFLIIVFSLKNL